VNSSPAIGCDGTIYVGSTINLYAINPDGTEKWIFKTMGHVISSPAIGSDGIIYVGSGDNRLYAINSNGTEKWNFTTGTVVNSSPAISSDGVIYIGSGDFKLYAINSNGTEKWNLNLGSVIDSSPAIGSDGTIYVGSWQHKLFAINPNGIEKWNFTTNNFIHRSSPAIGSEGSIYIGSVDDKLYSIHQDGSKKWSFTTGFDIISSPAIGSDGTIYVGSADNKLYAIGTLPVADAGLDQPANEGDIVELNGSASYDSDGIIESYEWDFDSSDGLWWETGATPDATDSTATYIYGDDGKYTMTLRVTEDKGGKDTDTCIIFTWNWSDGTSETVSKKYNDGLSPDSYPSPFGIFPFSATDTVQHTYGDNGEYLITLTIEDDDGGTVSINSTVVVNNVGPTITLTIFPSGDEGSLFTFEANASDPGSDDLTFSWDFEYGPTMENTYYNNNATPDPPTSPLGEYPFNVSDTVTHTYGDNHNYTLILKVRDDDGGTVSYTTTISVDNIAPSIIGIRVPIMTYEGQLETYGADAYDEGSDDLTFEWKFGDSTPIITNTYYNNGNGSDPYPSPGGNYPFYANDILNHTYGDDFNYTLTLKVTDDDGSFSILTTLIFVNNAAPIIAPFGPFTVDESFPINLTAISQDQGSDDLTFTWEFEMGPTNTKIYYNDDSGPDPYLSPWGTYPFSATDMVGHTYGDNGVFTVTLTVEDDDGGSTTYITNITVNNIAPTIESMEAYMYVNFTMRIAGEKWHSVNVSLFEDDVEIWSAGVTRHPGSPDEQAATLNDYKINLGSYYRTVVDYLPNDPRVNGNVWGANPVWIILEFQDGTIEKLHHTFNVKKSYWDSDHWNHIDPWEINLTSTIYKHNITFKATATDIGSDDLTFFWNFGDGGYIGPNTYFNNLISPDPFPSPEINPITQIDSVMHTYTAFGFHILTLFITDDDGGIISTTFDIRI
jgi:hypothetical protein